MSRTARDAANQAISQAAARFPEIPPIEPDLVGLSEADARLADAITRLTLRRWLTLEFLINRFSKRPVKALQPAVQASLLTGTAQLIFMNRLPDYAVVDQAIRSVRKSGNPDATGLVNAVLRKIAELTAKAESAFAPGRDLLPDGEDGAVRLNAAVMPSIDNLLTYISVATSIPLPLMQAWFKAYGREQACEIALHSITQPGVLINEGATSRLYSPEEGLLKDVLAAHPDWTVQDPTAAEAVRQTALLNPQRIYDACAGRGTKSKQLALLHPDATVVAWDPNDTRREDLQRIKGIQVRQPESGERFDLVVLDVPCSNTGVLARRPAARYRYTLKNLRSLIELQQQIIDQAMIHLAGDGYLLYSTCSIDPSENQEQAKYIQQQAGDRLQKVVENLTLPGGFGPTSRDGGYHVLLKSSAG
jgi:16S rRNA (cytosine967-C5)-methyltransferase